VLSWHFDDEFVDLIDEFEDEPYLFDDHDADGYAYDLDDLEGGIPI
jgi:hypothetical protein